MTYTKKSAARGSLSRAAPPRGRERHERSEYSRRVYRTSARSKPSARKMTYTKKPAARGSLSRAAPKRGRERHERSEYSRWVYQSPRTRGGICTSARSGPSARKMTYTKKSAARGSLSRAAPPRGRERHERSEYSRRVYRTLGETGRKGFFLRHSAEATQKHKSLKEAYPCGSHLFCDLRRHAREARFFGVSMKQIAISAATHSTVPSG